MSKHFTEEVYNATNTPCATPCTYGHRSTMCTIPHLSKFIDHWNMGAEFWQQTSLFLSSGHVP